MLHKLIFFVIVQKCNPFFGELYTTYVVCTEIIKFTLIEYLQCCEMHSIFEEYHRVKHGYNEDQIDEVVDANFATWFPTWVRMNNASL